MERMFAHEHDHIAAHHHDIIAASPLDHHTVLIDSVRLRQCHRLDGREIVSLRYYSEESPGSMDTLPGNAWARGGKTPSDGQRNRKQTANGKPSVRVKRRGKSSPRTW